MIIVEWLKLNFDIIASNKSHSGKLSVNWSKSTVGIIINESTLINIYELGLLWVNIWWYWMTVSLLTTG